MSDRFYSTLPINSERVLLEGPEAHHLLHVMRAAIGDQVTLFDNSGAEFPAIVEKLGRANVDLRVVERLEIDRELPFPLTVGVALPKGDRQKWLVEKLTELGVTTLVPLITERGVAQPKDSARERLERAVVEAAKQCGRNRLMQIASPQTWNDWLHQSASSPPAVAGKEFTRRGGESEIAHRCLFAHPGGNPLSHFDLTVTLPTHLAIGPEGGLTDTEVTAATSTGWQAVSLGPRILRVETAAVALAAAIALR